MKSFDDLDKNIDKYYEGSLNDSTSDELEIRSALDKMSIVNNIENRISIPIDISSIVEEGQEIHFNKNLKKATFKFLLFAIALSILIGFIYVKVSIPVVMTSQFIVIVGLLIINSIIIKRKARSEVK
ncbi:hypothetical protein UT300007_04700 [Clostridium sp. CTA-7]